LDFSQITVKSISRGKFKLAEYSGKVLLIVNVASECGFTPQYKNLQKLYDLYESKGLCVLAFPCNDFADQEPSSENEIRNFCDYKYGVTFDIFSKIKIRGSLSNPLFKVLESQGFPVVRPNGIKAKFFQLYTSAMFRLKEGRFPLTGDVQWNFHKFLIGRNGLIKGHFSSDCDPLNSMVVSSIEHELEVLID